MVRIDDFLLMNLHTVCHTVVAMRTLLEALVAAVAALTTFWCIAP